ncbi:phage capsid protein [Rhodococcus hoagii]|uniref:Phage capsid protein n=3 Tax=Rhodococcus hoagii TaxID=43767 RepID=A0A9Q2PDA0_RHOHA|nr:phage capsid protein [Prescottella equi]MBM4481179.1 phage capsid protein [Prescottella equi]MBM4489375.1 phage capsid protein [Prescottella equi]MBM4496228.1 phage capsid protein [Prescottella equi]MBM4509249.1 phage capsid protein [Prescottella equi]MBM4514616.1 phage capsid protein [Prescottella equi]
MPVSLAQAAQNAVTDLDLNVIDEFRTNQIMDLLTFDDAVNPIGGGGVLTYGYTRLATLATASFRAINSEYTPQEVTTQRYNVDLKPLGGSFQVDRILTGIGPAASASVALNLQQKIKSTQALFGDSVINGDSSVTPNSFDGLSKALAGSSTEDFTAFDWSGAMDEAKSYLVLETLDDLIGKLNGEPGAIISNKKAINRIKSAARRTSQYVERPGPRDTTIASYGNVRLIDAGYKAGSAADVIPVRGSAVTGPPALAAGSTDVYAVRFGLDGFHGVSTMGGQLVKTWLPDFSVAGAVKTGEVEMGPVAVALKATRAAAVLRNVKVQ